MKYFLLVTFMVSLVSATDGSNRNGNKEKLGWVKGRRMSQSVAEMMQPPEVRGKFGACEAEDEFGRSSSCMLMNKLSSCCNKRCVDTWSDKFHCGICNKQCEPGLSCCRGFCKDLNTDRKNCGECGLKCSKGVSCQFGICGYA